MLWIVQRLLHLIVLSRMHYAETKLAQYPVFQVKDQLISCIFKFKHFLVSALQGFCQRVLKPLKETALSLFKNSLLVLQVTYVNFKLFFQHGDFALQFTAKSI